MIWSSAHKDQKHNDFSFGLANNLPTSYYVRQTHNQGEVEYRNEAFRGAHRHVKNGAASSVLLNCRLKMSPERPTFFVSKGETLRLPIDVAFNSALARAIAYGFPAAERIGGASH